MKNTIRAALAILSLASGLLAGCVVAPDETTAPEETSAVTEALVNNGGGTGSLSWWCSEDGSCTCEGGTLSSDCWGLSQRGFRAYEADLRREKSVVVNGSP
ncbi:hypothetical protein WMF27_11290 [Sorangium sp. So ce281]|uniref:hypothetical protein n=1 Tax=unclassified Sorangium TaxID=2621164 RepID=UPI003F5FCDE3